MKKNNKCRCPYCDSAMVDDLCTLCQLRFVTCKNCGALMADRADHCPKCGAEHEKGNK